MHRDEHARCLSQFFDLKIIEDDCDYGEVCDDHRPDACLFEIGLLMQDARQPRVTNMGRKNGVPRLALMQADVWGLTRSRIFAEAEALDFDAIFSICTTAGEHFPRLADRLYYWPNFVDEDIFKDYHLQKQEIVFFTGATAGQYPWRRRVTQALTKALRISQSRHAGYVGRQVTSSMPMGTEYAKLIGSAWFAPTCGTVANELIRKHLEIPAVGTCLITEQSPALDLAGFSNMRNVVFADEHDVVDKIAHLLRNPDTLRDIIANGHELVHRKHTMRARSQIFDWLMLHRQASTTERIIQPDPFGPLLVGSCGQAKIQTLHVRGRGEHLRLLEKAVDYVNAGRIGPAMSVLNDCRRLMAPVPDVDFLRAYCNLHAGNPRRALALLVPLLKTSLDSSDTLPPDPIEWAYFIITLLALGRFRAAYLRARQFVEISHQELDRARCAVFLLKNAVPPTTNAKRVSSLHRLQDKGLSEWMASLAGLLEICGREGAAQRLKSFAWDEIGEESEIYRAARINSHCRRAVPVKSGRLRRFDNPLVMSAIGRRVQDLNRAIAHRSGPA